MKTKAASIRAFLLSTVAVLFLLALPVRGQILLVAGPGNGTVAQLDSFSRTVTKTYTVPGGMATGNPLGVAINPTETLAAFYSSDSGVNRVDFYDLTSAATTPSGASVTLTGSFGPTAEIAFTSDGACVVASHGPGSGEVSTINVATRTQVSVVGTGGRGVGTVPGHPHLAIAVGGNAFDVLTIASDCSATSGPPVSLGGGNLDGVAAFPNGQGALIPDRAGFVHVLSISAGGAVTPISTIHVGDMPISIAITPDGHHAYVYKGGAGQLRLLFIDPFGNVTDSGLQVTVPGYAYGPETGDFVATDGTTVFVSGWNFGGNLIAMVDVASFTNIGNLAVTGTFTFGVAWGGCPHHTVHGHIDTVPPGGHNGDVAGIHHGQHGHTVPAGVSCPPHAPGHTPGLMAEPSEEGLFTAGAVMQAPDFVAGLNQDGTLNGNPAAGTKVQPAHRGTVVQLFGSAANFFLDSRDLRAASGFTAPASGSPLFYTTSLPEVRIGGVAAQVLFSGLAPGLTGVWQINALIPDGVSRGNVPVTINYEGDELTSVALAIE